MAITEVSICNSAISKLGAERISSLSEDSKIARLCKERYAHIRDIVLYEHPWNFAMERVVLSQLPTPPAFGFSFQYDLPADCLRVIGTDDVFCSTRYVIEGRKILTDARDFSIKYIKRVTNPYFYTPSFAEAVALKLAIDLAYPVTQQTTREQSLYEQYVEHLRSCRSFDAQEGTPEELEADEFLQAHISGGSPLWHTLT